MNEVYHEPGTKDENHKIMIVNDKFSPSENIDHAPLTSELMVINSESINAVNNLKDMCLQPPHTLLNLENSFIITTIKDGAAFTGKLLSLENGRSNFLRTPEPPVKKQKTGVEGRVKEMLFSMQHTLLERLETIEKKVEKINSKCQCLEAKVENMLIKATTIGFGYDVSKKGRSKQIVLGVPVESAGDGKSSSHLKSLNCEDAYPEGSWLGNPDNPNWRVRCDICPKDLMSINESCTSAEKMALTLLDYLFDRETQACSNISGSGKHGKLQLDPLRIFAIRCHLMHMFNITEQQWHRIKLNIDSKCRTAFRRKQRGMPLTVKGFRERSPSELQNAIVKNENCPESSPSELLAQLSGQQSTTFITTDQESQNVTENILSQGDHIKVEIPNIIRTDHGDIHVIRATFEQ